MRNARILLLVLGSLACRAAPSRPPEPAPVAWEFAARGVSGKGDAQRFGRADFEALRELGARDFAFVPFGVLPGPYSPLVSFREPEPWHDELVRAAHACGLRVLLKPHLWIDQSWHGAVRMASDESWRTFFARYTEFLRTWAEFAAAHGVEVLCIGTELDRTLGQEREWRKLIAELRRVYSGRLLYTAHWQHVEDVPFQDALDAIGVSAYYPLAVADDATVDELRRAWEPIRAGLATLARRHDRPIVFTEVGWRPIRGALAQPWVHGGRGELDPELQARAYEAVLTAFEGEPWFGGLYFWEWFSLASFDQRWPLASSTGYSPQGHPAEDVLRRFWGARLR
ncbi:MAG: hypothetical protein ABL998_24660 [Planctomycetota bacterium]